jgi:hypothetical protein
MSILDLELNDDFYSKKLRLNPLDEPHLQDLSKLWKNGSKMELRRIMQQRQFYWTLITSMIELGTWWVDVINKESCASFFMDDATKSIVVISTTHNTKNVPTIWKGFNWESFLLGLLNMRAMFKIVVYICKCESFKSLLTIMCK